MRYVRDRVAAGKFAPRTTAPSVESTLLIFAGKFPSLLPRNLTRNHVEAWMKSRPLAPATRAAQLSRVRAFCDWLVDYGHVAKDPCKGVESPRLPRTVPRGLSRDQLASLLRVLPDARAELIVSLMTQEGLRCIEVSSLELGSIDFNDRTLFVTGKGGHERLLPISDETWQLIDAYLDAHPAISGPLIRSDHDDISSIQPATVSRLVAGWFRDAGLKSARWDGKSAHALRHTCGTDMVKAGAHLRDVQAALGHASISTTQRYIGATVKPLREAMGGRSYRT